MSVTDPPIKLVNPTELVGVLEIAILLDATRSTVYNWIDLPDFPAPVARLGKLGRVWLMPDVGEWHATTPYVARPVPEHGLRGYRKGCRCAECRAANATSMRSWRHAKSGGAS